MNIRFFLILLALSPVVFGQAVPTQADEAGLIPLSERLQDEYARSSTSGFLVDPQRLLRGREAKERREFLSYHSSDSLIDLHMVLFKGEQKLFSSADLSGHLLAGRSDSKPAVMVHYYMGRPERAEMFLSEKLMDVVPVDELSRSLNSAVERAQTGVSPMDELEKFMVQTSIRIYRMERLLSEGTASPAPLQVEEPKEVDADQAESEALMQQVKAFWSDQKYKIIGGLVFLSLLWWLRRWYQTRASFEFPECETQERLGGAHGAGVGAVIEFGKSSKPPAAQLEKLKLH